MAREFKRLAKIHKIDVQLKVIPKIGHVQTEKQNEMSRKFFENILLRNKKRKF